MLELKRILWNRKALLLFGILLLLHGIFFFFQCNGEKAITLTGAELEEYVAGYPAYIQAVHENVDVMKENPLFNAETSFVYRNLIKTGEDYAKLADVVPVAGENRGIITVLKFNLTSFILLIVGGYIVLSFLKERQKGLHLLVRCTAGGRSGLSLQRIGILCLGVSGAAVVLFISILLLGNVAFPGCDMTRPIQSIPELESVIGHYSIGEYIVVFLMRKVLGCIFACLLLYFFMSLFYSGLCIVSFFLLISGEYMLYAFVIPTGKWSALKYINLYTYTFCGMEYADYYNLNLFGRPCNIVVCSDLFVTLGVVVLLLLCLLQYARQYPRGEYRAVQFVEKLQGFFSRRKPLLSLMAWELKKVLISQKGLVVFVLLGYLAYSASTESNYLDFRSRYVTHWYEEYSGTIDEARVTEIREKKESLEYWVALWANAKEQLEQTRLRYQMEGKDTAYTERLIGEYAQLIEEYEYEIRGIAVVLEQAEKGYAYYQKSGILLELMDTTAYELLLVKDKKTILRNYLYTLLTVVIMLSGSMACEKAAHMDVLLHTFYSGRKRILLRKVIIMVGICVTTTLSIHLVQFFQIGRVFDYVNQTAPAQCISCARIVPAQLTIRQYMIGLYAVRCMISVAMGSAVMAVSRRFGRIATIALGVVLLFVPIGMVALYLRGVGSIL